VQQGLLTNDHALVVAWSNSTQALTTIRRALDNTDLPQSVLTIGVSGGLGRMERTPFSDGDLIVVVSDDASREDCRLANESIQHRMRDAGLAAPQAQGIYSSAVRASQLVDTSTLGQVAEDIQAFGCRMQLLLESQPVWRDDAFAQLLEQILDRFQSLAGVDPDLPHRYLMHDLVRYYRSLSIRYHAADLDDPPRWRLLNAKFRHSRRMSYVGLLALLSQHERQLLQGLRMTPIERVLAAASNSDQAERVARHYSEVLSVLADTDLRAALETTVEEEAKFASHATYASIHQQLIKLESDLSQLLFDRLEANREFQAQFLL